MLRIIALYGTIAGLIVGIPMVATMVLVTGEIPHSYIIGYTTMLVALSAVFVAIKRHRDLDLGGVIGFWPALGMGLGISFVAGVIYVFAWETACAIAHLDFANAYAKIEIAQQKAAGVSGAALAKFEGQM